MIALEGYLYEYGDNNSYSFLYLNYRDLLK